MSSYFVALITVKDPEQYGRYIEGFMPIFERYAGEVLAADDAPEALEGEWPAPRTVIIRFPSEAELLRWYRSPEYQQLMELRRSAAECSIAVVDGLG
jgi:uncharacterized protein (DUF1330 family)